MKVNLYIIVGKGEDGHKEAPSDIISDALTRQLYIFEKKERAEQALKSCKITWPNWKFKIIKKIIII